MFCPSCGQEVKLDQSVGSLLTHFLNDYFTFDSKIIRSVLPLISKPAFLTIEYLRGRRVQYIAPFRLFIFLSLIFFLLISWSNSSSISLNEEVNGFNEAFWNRFFDSWLPKLFFFLLPLFALIIAWLYRRQKRGMMPHFLFALHFHSSLFFMGIIYAVVSYIFRKLEWLIFNEIFLGLCGLYLAYYLWKSLRRMYSESRLKTSWKFIVLVVLYGILLIAFTFILLLFSYNY
ncbi:MAG: hypothetical protein ACJAV5_001697 [Vicingaceae bacterium]|jgi:hypothetical protein